MNNTRKIFVIRHSVYTLLMLLFYVGQTVPGLFIFSRIKPLLVIPAAIAVAMFEGEFVGGLYGAFAGLLCDATGGTLFGLSGFVIAVCCIFAGMLVIYLVRCNLFSCMLFVAVALLLRGGIVWVFSWGIWGYENGWKLFALYTFPAAMIALVLSAPVYLLVRRFHDWLAAYEEETR